MTHDHIVIVDATRHGAGIDGRKTARALHYQLGAHVGPPWGRVAVPVTFLADPKPIERFGPHHWPIYILDNPDVADALGYHDVDPNGHVYGRVFKDVSDEAGVSLSSVLSHEVVEAALDPWCNLWADLGHGRATALEACDAVEAQSYTIDGVEVSDFLLPSWFTANGKAPYSYLNGPSQPGELAPGGYAIDMVEGKVTQRFANDTRKGRVAGAPQPSRSEWRIIRELVP